MNAEDFLFLPKLPNKTVDTLVDWVDNVDRGECNIHIVDYVIRVLCLDLGLYFSHCICYLL